MNRNEDRKKNEPIQKFNSKLKKNKKVNHNIYIKFSTLAMSNENEYLGFILGYN